MKQKKARVLIASIVGGTIYVGSAVAAGTNDEAVDRTRPGAVGRSMNDVESGTPDCSGPENRGSSCKNIPLNGGTNDNATEKAVTDGDRMSAEDGMPGTRNAQ